MSKWSEVTKDIHITSYVLVGICKSAFGYRFAERGISQKKTTSPNFVLFGSLFCQLRLRYEIEIALPKKKQVQTGFFF